MKITVTQSGGITGEDFIEVGHIDTSGRAPAEGERIERALTALRQALSDTGLAIGADLPEYRIDLQAEDGTRETIVVTDDMDPANPTLPPLRDLLEVISA